MEIVASEILDTSGLLCPEPVMMLHGKIRGMTIGDIVEVIATDPSTTRDIPKFCVFLNHELLLSEPGEKNYRYFIKKC
ncbi:MAG: tRNA 2-thiouridine synthesizing protein A [Paraglaciecola psychrophila]|jgi:tRNA 2-thiouridine synthesizing protein A